MKQDPTTPICPTNSSDLLPSGRVAATTVSAEADWLRGLGRRLVREADVDDLVQDTWLEAMKRPLRLEGSLRGWLRTVATRLAHRHHRSNRRRQARELLVDPTESTPATDVAVLWGELRHRLQTAVAGLPEPYRATIRLRYYDGLSARDIAHRTQTPLATVRIRLQRGMGLLRGDVSRHYGPDWRPALLGVLLPTGAAPGLETPILATGRRSHLLAAGLVAATTASLLFGSWPEAAPMVSATASNPPTPVDGAGQGVPGETQPHRVALPSRPHHPATRRVAGRIVDAAGRPLAGVKLVFRRLAGDAAATEQEFGSATTIDQVLGHADQSGHFDLPCPHGTGALDVASPWVGLRLWPLQPESRTVDLNPGTDEARIVAVRSRRVVGAVFDAAGRPLAGVRIVVRCEQLPHFPEILDRQLFVDPLQTTRTDAEGRFELDRFPLDCPARVHLARAGHRDLRIVPGPSNLPLRITMAAAAADDPIRIAGRVFDSQGRAVCAATVGMARHRTATDGSGAYRLELGDVDDGALLFAGKPGHGTAIRRDLAARLRRHRGGTVCVDLTLGTTPKSISGILTDGRGVPLPDQLVFLADPLHLDEQTTAEGLAAGQDGPLGARDAAAQDGSFRIDGLGDRRYALRVFDPIAATTVDGGSHPAGSRDVRIEIRQERFVTRHGRLLDDRGMGIPGAKLYFGRDPGAAPALPLRKPVVTDADGSFLLRRLPRDGGTVFVVGGGNPAEDDPGVVPSVIHFDAATLSEHELEITVPRLCHFRVFAPEAPAAATIHFLDDYGRELHIFALDAGGARRFDRWVIEAERTEILCASHRARTVVLSDVDGIEIARSSIQLTPGFVTEIDL